MQNLGDFEMWRQRREEFAREAEERRLARRLRSSHQKDTRSALAGRVTSWARKAVHSPLTEGLKAWSSR